MKGKLKKSSVKPVVAAVPKLVDKAPELKTKKGPVRIPFQYVHPDLVDPKARAKLLASLGIESWAPHHKTRGAACVDYRAAVTVVIPPMRVRPIPTGIKIALPPGFELSARPRSGLFINHQVFVVGTIDDDYRGEIKVLLANFGESEFKVNFGDRIGQFKLSRFLEQEYFEAENLEATDRGAGGFGSTGVR